MKKRALSVILALALLIGILPIQANANMVLYNGLRAQFYEDHVEISGYTGSATEVVIPGKIGGLPVTVITEGAFYSNPILTSITIPSSVTSIGLVSLMDCSNLIEIHVDEDNPNYSSDDQGVLFDKEKTTLLRMPCAFSGSYTIPDGVTSIDYRALDECNSLVTVSIPDTLTSTLEYAIGKCDGLIKIHVDEDNPNYSSDDRGVLFDKEKTHLIRVPSALSGSYTLPDSVTSIKYDAFWDCNNLTSISIPDTLPSIDSYTFTDCSSLNQIYVSENNPNFSSDDRGVLFDKGKKHLIWVPSALFGSYTIPDGVTLIDDYAFWNCTSLVTVSIPDTLTSIWKTSFKEPIFCRCSSLTGIYVSENHPTFSSDDRGVLFNKTKTKLVLIPTGFSGSYTVPDGVTIIGEQAAYGNRSLTKIDLPDSVISIQREAFSYCENLSSINSPNNLVSIGEMAFYDCGELTSIDLPESVKRIEGSAFSGCGSLKHIYFRGDAPQFDSYAFSGVTATAYYLIDNTTWTEDVIQNYGGKITWVAHDPNHTHEYTADITAPTCTEQGFTTYACSCGDSYVVDYTGSLGHDYADSICSRCGRINDDLLYTIYADHVQITQYTGSDATVVIPSEIEGLPVTIIDDYAFKNSTLTSISIPDSVTSIGKEAFYNSRNLSRIIFQGNAPQIKYIAFGDVVAIAYYPSGNPTWTEDALQDYGGAIVWSSDVPVPPHDFHRGTTRPASCAAWGYNIYTCRDCDYSFERYDLAPDGHKYKNKECIYCGWPETGFYYTLYEDHAEFLEAYLYKYKCVIPAELEGKPVTVIGGSAFNNDTELVSVSIPDSVTTIGSGAFWWCMSLDNVSIPEGVTRIRNYTFYGCYCLSNIDLPDSVTSIDDYAFCHCSGLSTIDLPDNLTSIGFRAFCNCENLRRIDIPDGVTSIGEGAFTLCTRLKSIVFQGDAPQFGLDAFGSVTATAYYPAGNPTWTEDVMQDYGGNITWVEHAPSHEYTAAITAPTCTKKGFTTYTCVCGDKYVEDYVDALGHDYAAVITAPTCTKQGFTTYTCSCGDSYVSDYVDALGHDYVDNTCTRCSHVYKEIHFTDVPDDAYYKTPVLWAVDSDITAGTSKYTFSPDDSCLRSQVVTFLWAAAGKPEPNVYTNPFTDVDSSDWFYKPVLWAVENGITSGVNYNQFGTDDVCTRAQVVTFLWKVAGSPEPATTLCPFTDVDSYVYFYKAVLWAVENGITSGTSATTFGPTAPCNRAQVVTFLYAAYN